MLKLKMLSILNTNHRYILPTKQQIIHQLSSNNNNNKIRLLSTTINNNKTGILMLNMGGPSNPNETGPFLQRLFTDQDIIDLGGGKWQQWWGTTVARRRTPRITKQYEEIGGSPIRKWSEHQGKAMCEILDRINPETAPHKAYVGFRYADPLTQSALIQMKQDGIKRAIAFSQFPQWSCTTTGSSLNELWRDLRILQLQDEFKWSIIDRWPTHSRFIDAVVERIEQRLPLFTTTNNNSSNNNKLPLILFSAHSVPIKVVNKGDPYTIEVAATVRAVMDKLRQKGINTKHMLAWQSKVGYLPWQGPSTSNAIEELGKTGYKNLLVVPIAFTSDHIETLFEIGIEYRELAHKVGFQQFVHTEGLNGSPTFALALAEIVQEHLSRQENYSPQYKLKCLTCDKPQCRGIVSAVY
jgi:ferrochelatase